MPKIRRSFKQLHYEDWKDWQKEAYLGIHTKWDFSPALDAHGYQWRQPIPVCGTVKPYTPFDKPAPQVEYWFPKEAQKKTLGQRIHDWLNKKED